MRKSIQEWPKQNLWNTAFKKFEVTRFEVFKGCILEVLAGPFINTLFYVCKSLY